MKRLTVFVLLFLVAVFAFSVASQGNAATEKRLLRATFAWPTYIDPAVGKDISGATALQCLYDPLVYPDTNGNPLPHVAKSWESSPDGLTWTFHLRSGIKFHDGTELTAEDVKFSMGRLLTMGEGHSFLFLGRIKETEAVDRYTVKFHMERPFGPFLSTLFQFYILNKNLVMRHIKKPGSFGDMGDYGREWLLTHDAGSGA
jgi:peptide/nickel transport system substrate-binding protein